MTVDELITKLQEIKHLHGGDELVIVIGLYSSESDIEDVKRIKTDYMSRVEIESSDGGKVPADVMPNMSDELFDGEVE